MTNFDPNRPVGEEARKAHANRVHAGFVAKYLSGPKILDIGYRGYRDDVVPIVPAAIGVELDYPGYDGRTLPFPALSQDAVFASHCLEHITDVHDAIRDWFRVLRYGGFLLVMVPHQFLYEKKTALPSDYNGDHKRFYTPASLMAEIEAALPPNAYRLRHLADNDQGFDYALPPDQHSGGSYEIEIVVERIIPPAWALARPPIYQTDQPRPLPTRTDPAAIIAPTGGHPILTYDFGATLPPNPRILALKLDHLGDFIIGLPSLHQLRRTYPGAHITLVVGSWNRAAAEAAAIADNVETYDYFPHNSFGWNGVPIEPVARFRTLVAGHWDLAIDLRVDEDTRLLLAGVDASIRAGIGARARHPFLDIILPAEHHNRRNAPATNPRHHHLSLDQFDSRMPTQTAFYHEAPLAPFTTHMIYGPHITLPQGALTVTFALELTGWPLGLGKSSVTLDVARNGEIVALRRLRNRELRQLSPGGTELCFENTDPTARYEFRVFVEGRSPRTNLRFAGVRIDHAEAPILPRLRRAELHIGEQLSLLVQLTADRTRPSYPLPVPHPASACPLIVIAPLSNSELRDWPLPHYVTLITGLLGALDCTISLIGTAAQTAQLERVTHQVGDPRVQNRAGRTSWSEIPALLGAADLVICNNSGIAHAAAAAGALTLAIYSASHQPQEWGPRGPRSHALMAQVPCSPCGHDRLPDCPNHHTCMQNLPPAAVLQHACLLLSAQRMTSVA